MTTTADTVAGLIVAALLGTVDARPTAAGDRVYAPRDWPVDPGLLPIIAVQTPKERKQSLGPNGAAQFDVRATIRVIGRLTMKAIPDGKAAEAALAALAVLQRQIEVAVINSYDLTKVISEIESVDTQNEVKSEGAVPLAEVTMDFVCVFYQGPEDFAPIASDPFTELAVYGDLINVASPTGIFVPPFDYPTTPSPRTEGPEGRVEIGAVIPIPQP